MKTIIGIIVAIAAVAGIVFFAGHKKAVAPMQTEDQSQTEAQTNPMTTSTGNSAPLETLNPNAGVDANVSIDTSIENKTIAIKNFAYSPATVTIKAGSTVTWNQQDSAPHTVTADDNSFASPTLGNGKSYSFTFTKAGTYTYHCAIHPMMKGTIIVQ